MRRSKTQEQLYRLLGGLLCLCMLVSEVGGVATTTAFAAEPSTEAATGSKITEPASTPEGTTPSANPTEVPADTTETSRDTEGMKSSVNPTGVPENPEEPTGSPTEPIEVPTEIPAAPGPTEAPQEPVEASLEPAEAPQEPVETSLGSARAPMETAADPEPIAAPNALEDTLPEIYVPRAPAGLENTVAVQNTVEGAAASLPNGGTIWLTGNVALDGVDFAAQTVTIKSYGEGDHYTLTKADTASKENMFSLSNGAALTLENVTVDAAANTAGRTVSASGGSTLTLGEGSVLENNNSYGAVYLDGSAINIAGGTIQNNNAAAGEGSVAKKMYNESTSRFVFEPANAGKQGLGGAVLMVDRSTFNMTAGEISGNSAICGGGVYAYDFAAMSVTGGSFTGNTAGTVTANQAYGGALHVDGTATGAVQIGGSARFSHNSAQRGGALSLGIDADEVDLTITGGTFESNISATYGSIAFINSKNSVIDISGALFTGNSAQENGGIYKAAFSGTPATGRGKIVIHGGARFTNNTALKGPCLYITKDNADAVKEFLVDGASFTGNSASDDAGVIQYNVPNSTFKIINGTFENNRSGNRGGCFFAAVDAKGTTFTFEKSTFTGNYARNQGGVWRGFPPQSEFVFTGCTFTDNTAETGDGGCFYFPGDGPDSSITIDGGTFTGNKSGSSGGAFRANLDGGTVTVKGGAVFKGNVADVNAGAFSIRRRGAEYKGEVYLLSCTVDGNICNSDYSRYSEADKLATEHYNTGGVYIGENITCYMYDALVTGNSVSGGYESSAVGNGIGLCPNAQVFLYPEHGAMIYGNGDNGGMDILAVPYDYPAITHETPAKLYVSDTTPDGRAYNWTDLTGGEARTGGYDWTNIRSGIATASAADGGYHGETDLKPAGFKAHVADAGLMTTDVSTGGYSVYIINNITKSALYAGGGMMVNGTVISGDLGISVQKKTVGLDEQQKANTEFGFTFTVGGYSSSDPINVKYTLTGRGETKSNTATFTYKDTSATSGGPSYGMQCSFTLKSDQKITFDFKDSGFSFSNGQDYTFWLEETDMQGATSSRITYIAYDEDGNIITDTGSLGSGSKPSTDTKVDRIEFVCTNVFEQETELDLTKKVKKSEGDLSTSAAGRLWDFDIKLTDAADRPVSGTFSAEVVEDDEFLTDPRENGLTMADGSWIITFDAGASHVRLKHGQTLKVFGLPAGTKYAITEPNANTGGYTTEETGSNGTIPAGPNIAKAEFTNKIGETANLTLRKEPHNGDQDIDFSRPWHIRITLKNNDPDVHLAGEYKYNNTADPDNDIVVVDNDGNVHLKDGGEIFLKMNHWLDIYDLPVGTEFSIVEVEADQGGFKTYYKDGKEGNGELNTNIDLTLINEQLSHGDLTVSKTVSGPGAELDRLWSFQITLTNDSPDAHLVGDYPYEIKTGSVSADPPVTGYVTVDQNGSVKIKDPAGGDGSIKLKHDQSITIKGLPADTHYEVKETEANQDGYTTSPTQASGDIAKNAELKAAFTNTRQTGSLIVSKTVTGNAGDKEKEWTFNIVLENSDGTFPAGEYSYEIKGPGAGDTKTGKVTVGSDGSVKIKDPAGGDGSIKLKHDQSITITGLPAGAAYTVTETEANTPPYTTTSDQDQGQIPSNDTVEAKFTNTARVGNLTVSKTVAEGGDKNKVFKFTITLDARGTDYAGVGDGLSGTYGYTGTVTKQSGDSIDEGNKITFKNGRATVYLKHGQSITIEGLPADVKYTVTEEAEHYTATWTDSTNDTNTGTIPDGGAATVKCTNTIISAKLPETGGPGPMGLALSSTLLCLAGCLIILFATGWRGKHSRRARIDHHNA